MNTSSSILPIVETFYSLQGEGYNAGKAAFFIRLAGCRVRCAFCDSKNSWDENKADKISTSDLTEQVVQSGAKQVVITGGEPLMHNLDELCAQLKKKIPNVDLWIETTGTEKWSGNFDWVCLSPKKHALPLPGNYSKADELKIIIKDENDLIFAEEQALKVNPQCRLFLQAEWDSRTTADKLIFDYILKNPRWRQSVQIHKYLDIL